MKCPACGSDEHRQVKFVGGIEVVFCPQVPEGTVVAKGPVNAVRITNVRANS